jgi:hypothetical protein
LAARATPERGLESAAALLLDLFIVNRIATERGTSQIHPEPIPLIRVL